MKHPFMKSPVGSAHVRISPTCTIACLYLYCFREQ